MSMHNRSGSSRWLVSLVVLLLAATLAFGCAPSGFEAIDALTSGVVESGCAVDLRAEGTLHWSACG